MANGRLTQFLALSAALLLAGAARAQTVKFAGQNVPNTFSALQTFNPSTTPGNIIKLDIAAIGGAGTRDSHTLEWCGRANDGTEHTRCYRSFVDVTGTDGAATWKLQTKLDAGAWTDVFSAPTTGIDASTFFSTGTIPDARIDGSAESDEVVLAGDVDGTANANDLDEDAVETELEAVLDLQDLQGAVTDGQVPNNITVDLATLATTATTANAGDSATAFFSAGALELAIGGTNQTSWTASRCVRVNAGGTALESAAADCSSGGGDSITVATVAATDPDIIDSGRIDFTLDTGAAPDTITADIVSGSLTATHLGTDSVSADELNATGVEAELEAVLDLADLQGDLALGTKTSGNYVDDVTAGTGIAVTHTPGEGSDAAVALDFSDAGASPGLSADQARFTSNATVSGFIVFEGDTADTIETRLHVVDPTASDKTFTIPNADSVAVQPLACTSTDKVSAISALGVITCSADEVGVGGGDAITVATVAATDPDIIDSGRIDFTLNTAASPDTITADIVANSVNATHIDETTTYTWTGSSTTHVATSFTGPTADPADSGVFRVSNAETMICAEAAPAGTDVCLTVDASEVIQITGGTLDAADLSGIVPDASVDGSAEAGEIDIDNLAGLTAIGSALTITNTSNTFIGATYAGPTADSADSGIFRLGNNETGICWEAAPAGTDVCLTVDASEIVQISGGTLDGGDLTTASVTATQLGPDSVSVSELDETVAYAFSSTTNTFVAASYTDGSANPADAGVLRCGNNAICFAAEIATPGTDKTWKLNASDVWETNAGITIGTVSTDPGTFTLGLSTSTTASWLKWFGGDAATNAEAPYIQMVPSPAASGDDSFLFPCSTGGNFGISSSTPAANCTAAQTISKIEATETLKNKTLAAADNVIEADDLICTNCIGATEISDLALGTDTSGNYVADVAGTASEITISGAAGEGWTATVALAAQLNISGKEIIGGATPVKFEGLTDDNFYSQFTFTDPTATRTHTFPNADSNTVQPLACSSTDKVRAISAAGVITCAADETGAGGGDAVSVNSAAAADADLDDADPAAPANGFNVRWQLNTTPAPDSISAHILTTDIGTTTFGSGSAITWTFNAGATDPTVVFDSASITANAASIALAGNVGVGEGGPVATRSMNATRTKTDPTATEYGVVHALTLNETAGAEAQAMYGAVYNLTVGATNTQNFSNATDGLAAVAATTQIATGATGTVTSMTDFLGQAVIAAGTLTNRYGFRVQNSSGAGTVTNQYGLYVESLTDGATVNEAIHVAGTNPSSFGGSVRLRESGGGADYLGLQAKSAITASRTLTLNLPESGDCTGTNGGALTILSDEIVCSDDDGGAGGGDAVSVNSAAAADADFDDADPAAPANGFNVRWQLNTTPAPDSISAHILTTDIGTTTFGSGSAMIWTFNASGGTDPTLRFGDGEAQWTGNFGIGVDPTQPFHISNATSVGNSAAALVSLTGNRNGVQVTSADAASSDQAGFVFSGDNSGDRVIVSLFTGDSIGKWMVDISGAQNWGPGGAGARDVRLYRTGTNVLEVDNNAGGAATLKVTGTLNATVALQTNGTERLSATGVATNVSYDAEATGNAITKRSFIYLEAAACNEGTASLNWDAPTGDAQTAPTEACNDTGAIQRPTASFSGSAVNGFERTIVLPVGWTGNIDLDIDYVTVAASPTGNVEFDVSTVCRAVAESWDASFNAAQTITDAAGAQNAINRATQANVTNTGCAAEEHLTIRISRDGTNDTNNDAALVLGARVTLRWTD